MTVQLGIGAVGRGTKRVVRMVHLPGVVRTAAQRLAASRWQETALLVIASLAILRMREGLVGWTSQDYTDFLSRWFAFLQANGFSGLGQEFADYNVPYLYLLWIGTLVSPTSGLAWVKFLGSAADLLMALGAFALLGRLRAPRFVAAGSAVLLLLVPEVLLNSAVWGQADSLYTGIIVWALYFLVRHRPTAAWALFALALSFKLQALFVLPAFALAFVVQRQRARSLAVAALVFMATYLPALVAGRSIGSLLSIYSRQAGQYPDLTMYAASLYAWLPQASADTFRSAGTSFALAVNAVLLAVLIRRFRSAELDGRALLQVTALFAITMPFTLPSMHERYFYTAGVLIFLLAIVRRRYVLAVVAGQVVAVQSYTFFLFRVPSLLPVPLLVLVQLGIIVALLWPLLVDPDRVTGRTTGTSARADLESPTVLH